MSDRKELLNEAFAEVDESFILMTEEPPKKKKAIITAPLVAAMIALVLVSSALTATLTYFSTRPNDPPIESSTPSDSTPGETPGTSLETPEETPEETPTEHLHDYVNKDTRDIYLKSAATCTSPALYYLSCQCGQVGSETFTSGDPLSHSYKSRTVLPTCGEDGYTLHYCVCGDSYKDSVIPQTHDHDFRTGRGSGKNSEGEMISYDAYICTKCELEAIYYGNSDGTIPSRKTNCRYYVTGNIPDHKDFTLVIHGSGEMPSFSKTEQPMWYDYLLSIKKIIVAEGITSVGSYAFYHPDSTCTVEYSLPDSLKTVNTYGIRINTRQLILGNSVETVYANALPVNQFARIYLPASLKFIYGFNSSPIYLYAGSTERLLSVKTSYYNSTVTLGEWLSSLGDTPLPFSIYVNAENVNDNEEPYYGPNK